MPPSASPPWGGKIRWQPSVPERDRAGLEAGVREGVAARDPRAEYVQVALKSGRDGQPTLVLATGSAIRPARFPPPSAT